MKDKKYSISQVSNIVGYENHVLRYYENEFNLNIPRNKSNHRYYTIDEINIFKKIKKLQKEGFSNKQISLIINSPDLINSSDKEVCATTMIKSHSDADDMLKKIEIESIRIMEGMRTEILEILRNESDKDKDVLMCENAKLRMKLKEKTYELTRLKDKLNSNKNKTKKFLFFKKN